MIMSKVSVIIPTYNQSKLLKEAIKSVLQQSFTDFEILVIDDGSTDDTSSIVEQTPDNRVKYFYKNNGGESSARNLGLTKAHAEYIAFLDSDDLWPNNYLQTMVTNLQSNTDYNLAYSKVMELHDDGRMTPFAKDNRYKAGWLTQAFFEGGPCILPSATMIRRSIRNESYFDEALTTAQDNDVYLRLSVKTPFLFVSETYILRRESPYIQAKYCVPDNQCNPILSMERFVYQFGGLKYVSHQRARHVLSHKCRRAGRIAYSLGNRRMAQILFKKAIVYWPRDIRLYVNLAKTIALSKKNDNIPDWQMPKPLPLHITVTCDTKTKERKSFTEQ